VFDEQDRSALSASAATVMRSPGIITGAGDGAAGRPRA
jgi:hypothetical protein